MRFGTTQARRADYSARMNSLPSLLAISLIVAACAPVAPAPTSTSVAQTLVIATGSDTGPLNPHDYNSSFVALDLVYEPLIRYEADGTFSPALAEAWSISDDGLTWTFQLRQGVTFHDGTPFNAEAARWNLERWVGTDDHSWLPTTTRITRIETPAEHTLVLTMSGFYYPTLQDLTLVRPVRFLSPASVGADGAFASAVGTGPWRLESYVRDQQAVFVPYENYWGDKPTLTQVTFEVVPDAQTRIAALLTGEADLIGGEYIGGIPIESLPALRANSAVQVITAPGSTGFFLYPNNTRAPFDDPRVRRAFSRAIDRQALSASLFAGLARPASGIFPEGVPYVAPTGDDLYRFDLAAARALLDEAGWVAGGDGIRERDGERLALDLVLDSAMFPQATSMAEAIQAQWRDLGAEINLQVLDYDGWLDRYYRTDFDLLMNITWGSPYDPHSSLNGMFRSSPDETAVTFFTDPALDTLIDSALAERDEAKRQALFGEIWRFLDEQAAVIPVVTSSRVYAVRSEVSGFALAGTEYELDLNQVMITAP